MLWKNRWDIGAFSAKLSQGDGPPPHNPPSFFSLFPPLQDRFDK